MNHINQLAHTNMGAIYLVHLKSWKESFMADILTLHVSGMFVSGW